jgi:hypothetical protein
MVTRGKLNVLGVVFVLSTVGIIALAGSGQNVDASYITLLSSIITGCLAAYVPSRDT